MINRKNLCFIAICLLFAACSNVVEENKTQAQAALANAEAVVASNINVEQISNSSEKGLKGIGCIEFLNIVVDFDYIALKYEDLKELKLDLYSKIGDRPSHFFWQKKLDAASEMRYILKSKDGKEEAINFRKDGFFWHGTKQYSLQFYSRKKAYIEVKINDRIFWIKEEDLNKNDLKASTWKEYFSEHSSGLSVLYNLNLRAKPTKESAKITLIEQHNAEKSAVHQLAFTGNFEGNWAEIKLRRWKDRSSFCSSKAPLEQFSGWIKYLDDTGFPNLLDRQTICLAK